MTTTVCKEHEWVEEFSVSRNKTIIRCKNCPQERDKIDFRIEDNLKVISDNEWEDIFEEFLKENKFVALSGYLFNEFYRWLKENYSAPEKK